MRRFKSAFKKDGGRDGAPAQQQRAPQPQAYPVSPPGQQQHPPQWPSPPPPPQQQQQFQAAVPLQVYPAHAFALPTQHAQAPQPRPPAPAQGHDIEESYTLTHSRATPPERDPVQLALLHSPSPLQLSPETAAADAPHQPIAAAVAPQPAPAPAQQQPQSVVTAAPTAPPQPAKSAQPQSVASATPAASATSRESSATLGSPSPAPQRTSPAPQSAKQAQSQASVTSTTSRESSATLGSPSPAPSQRASRSTTLQPASPTPPGPLPNAVPAPAALHDPTIPRLERTGRSGAAVRNNKFGAAQLVAVLEDKGTPDAAGVAVGARLARWVSLHITDRDPRTQACALRAIDVVSDGDVVSAFKTGSMALDTRLRLARALASRSGLVDQLLPLLAEEDPRVAAVMLPYASANMVGTYLRDLLPHMGRWSALAKRHPGAMRASLEGAMSREDKYALRPKRYALALAALVKRAPRLVPFLWPWAVAPTTRPYLVALAGVMPEAALLALKDDESLDPSRRLLRKLGRSGVPQVTDYAVHLAKRGEGEVLGVFLRDMPPTLRRIVGTACKGHAVRWVDIVKTFSLRDAAPIAIAEMKAELSFEDEMEWVTLLDPDKGNELLFTIFDWPETSAKMAVASALMQLNARMRFPQLVGMILMSMARFGVTDPPVAHAVATTIGTLPPHLLPADMMPLLEPVVLAALEATDGGAQVLLDLVCNIVRVHADSKPHVDLFVSCFAAIVAKAGAELDIEFPVFVHRRGQERYIYSLFKPHVDAERAKGSFSLLGSLPAALHPHTANIPALQDDIGVFLFSAQAGAGHWATLVPNLVYHYLLPRTTQRARLEKILERHPSVAGLDFAAVHLGQRYPDLLEPYISGPLPGSSVDKPQVFIPFPDGRCTAAWTAEQVDTLLRTYRRVLANPFAERRVWQSIFRVLPTIRGGVRVAEDYLHFGDPEISRWAYSAYARCPSLQLGRWKDPFYGMFMVATQPPVYDKAKVTQGELDAWLGRYVQPFHLQCMFTASRFSLPSDMVEMLRKFFADPRWSMHERAGVAAFAFAAYRLPASQVRMELIHDPTIEGIAATPNGAQERMYAIATRLLGQKQGPGWDLLVDALESQQSYSALGSLRPQDIAQSYHQSLATHLATLAKRDLTDTECINCLAALVPYLTADQQRVVFNALSDLFTAKPVTTPKTSYRFRASLGPIAAGRHLCRLAREPVATWFLSKAVEDLVSDMERQPDSVNRYLRDRVTKGTLDELYRLRDGELAQEATRGAADIDERPDGAGTLEAMRSVAEILGKHTSVFGEEGAHLYNYMLNVDAPADDIVAHIRKTPRLVRKSARWLGVSRVLEGKEGTPERQAQWLKVARVLADDESDEVVVLVALDILEFFTANEQWTPEWRGLLAKLRRNRFEYVRKAALSGGARWGATGPRVASSSSSPQPQPPPSAHAVAMRAAADALVAKTMVEMGATVAPVSTPARGGAAAQGVQGYTV